MTGLSPEQTAYQQSVSRFLKRHSPTTSVRQQMETERGYDEDIWHQLCWELGVSCIHIPEPYGGNDFGLLELGIIAQEMGRTLYCGPFFSSIVMSSLAVLVAADESAKQRLLPIIGEGQTLYTVALDHLDDVSLVGTSISAERQSDHSYLISGRAPIVVDAHTSKNLLVFAAVDEETGLFEMSSGDDEVGIVLLQSIDATRKVCEVTFDNVKATRIGSPTRHQIETYWDQLSLILCFEMIGGAEALLEATVEYMKTRFQFGRAIGSFQGLKHRCADLKTDLELARASTFSAATELASVGQAYEVNLAKSRASDVFMDIAIAAIQLHGGMGFTWENDTHLWFKRAKSCEVLFGAPHWHRERAIARMLEGQP